MSLQFLTGPRPLALLTITHSYLGVSHFLRTRVESVINRAKKTDGGNDHGKISSRFHAAWLRTLPQRGRVSISKGRSVRGKKRPRGPGGVERVDRSRLSKHASNDHRRPIGGRLRPSQNHGVVGNLKLFLRKRRRKLGQGRWISSRSICRARAKYHEKNL